MPVPLFDHRPERCPFGHSLARGMPQRVGWKPCICTPAREASERGLGMRHLWVSRDTCHGGRRYTTFYEPPHDIRHHRANPWQKVLPLASRRSKARMPSAIIRRGPPATSTTGTPSETPPHSPPA